MYLAQSTNWGHFPDRIGIYIVEMFFFLGEGKSEVPGEKPLGASTRTNNKLNPHYF